jgi:low affinity Fe/Cu permease
MREVRIYDGDFPTFEQMLAGGSAAAFPKEIWLQKVQLGEFAVRYKDFKTGLARNPAGEHVQSSEICRIFSSLEEARANSTEVAKDHWTVRCFIYDHTGTQVGIISNNKEVSKYALVVYAGILLWIGIFAIIGMSLLWVVSKITLVVLAPFLSIHKPLSSFGWVGWTTYAIAGVFVGIFAWYLRIQFIAKRKVDRLHSKLNSIITPEEKKRFGALNTLPDSKDPAERERFLKLATEYQQKVSEALKK